MSSILDISSMYDSYSQNASAASTSSTESALSSISSDSSDEELMSACKSFESYFVQKMIEQMKSTVDSEDDDGEYMQYFGDTLNETIADEITDSGQIGLAQQLYDSMKTQYNL